jgi:glyoxylase-like metal-dependent hydrolase (beta-lactamase superfamily II)
MKYDKQIYTDKSCEYIVHTISSGPETFFTNAFVIETDHSLVVIDSMMTVSDAKIVREYINSMGKPLVSVLVSHGHPDHYNGVGEIIEGFADVPVIATVGVDEDIRRMDDAKEVKWKPHFGNEWPESRVFPNCIVDSGFSMNIDGIPFQVFELGPGESNCDIYWVIGESHKTTFVGDIVFNGTHSYMNDGHSSMWLRSLDTLKERLSDVSMLYTGHGPHDVPDTLISDQKSYVNYYRELLSNFLINSNILSDSDKHKFISQVKDKYPGYGLDVFVEAGIESVANELIKEGSKQAENIV